ncbi:MAG TPA: sigma-70 family RNA polymerase sigma factor [Kofleriaceae bacterium]|nr:sigma-70 family RNA polymerase sigma factor [Kofleriaceae bacterium]
MADDVEARLTRALGERAYDRVATLAVEAYGAELHGFLLGTLGNPADAGDVFSQVMERFWRGLPRFAGRCSVRTWLYLLARHAEVDHRRSPWHGARRTGDAQLDEIVDRVRSQTPPWQRTEVKDRWSAVRAALPPDDRALLVLRVDRDLAWADIARITLGDPEPDTAALDRESRRLRKRFQLLKERLRAEVRAAAREAAR